MVVDTSALVAVLAAEPGWRRLLRAMEEADRLLISAASLVEAGIVMDGRLGPRQAEILDQLLDRLAVEIVPVDAAQASLAREAFRRFGKGRHSPRLNFGDLFAHALAQSLGEPLLFVGDDFSRTDIVPALA
jgi:ribonuclease VapC